MKGKLKSVISLSIIVLSVLYLSNCTVLFASVGRVEDSRTPDIAKRIPGWEAKQIKSGSEIIVNLKDETMSGGEYLGIDSFPNENFDEEYAELQKQMPEGTFLPSKGDTIKVSSELITYDNLKFLGFDNGRIIISSLDRNNAVKLELENLENITDNYGNKTEGEAIRNLISEGRFPDLFFSGIYIKEYQYWKDTRGEAANNDEVKRLIYLNDIEQIQIKSKKNATRNLAITGFLLDAGMAVYFITVLSRAICWPILLF
jgi:hypothetical protein